MGSCQFRSKEPRDFSGFRGSELEPVYECYELGGADCIERDLPQSQAHFCGSCPFRVEATQAEDQPWPSLREIPQEALRPSKVARIEGLEGKHVSNCSILSHHGRTYLAFRNGWDGCSIWFAELEPQTYRVKWQHELRFPPHKDHNHAQEDPRLFVYRDELHLSYTAVDLPPGDERTARVMWAKLSKRFQPIECWAPYFAGSRKWEKNWTFFEHKGELLSVYDSCPLRIGKLSRDYRAYWIELTRFWNHPKELGLLRGGASPIYNPETRELYCFAHSSFMFEGDPWYAMSLYTISTDGKFEPRRFSPLPLMVPRLRDNPAPEGWQPKVVYPAGAILDETNWVVSYGYHDWECRLATFSRSSIESILEPIK